MTFDEAVKVARTFALAPRQGPQAIFRAPGRQKNYVVVDVANVKRFLERGYCPVVTIRECVKTPGNTVQTDGVPVPFADGAK